MVNIEKHGSIEDLQRKMFRYICSLVRKRIKTRLFLGISVVLCIFILAQAPFFLPVGDTINPSTIKQATSLRYVGNRLVDMKSFIEGIYYSKNIALQSFKRLSTGPRTANTHKESSTMKATGRSTQKARKHEAKPVCNIPQLDPFHQDAMQHIRTVKKLVCPQIYFTRVEGQHLVADVDDVHAAYLEYIKRAEDDDNNVIYSSQVSLIAGFENVEVKPNTVGCIIDENQKVLSAESSNTKVRVLVSKDGLRRGNCTANDLWHVSPSGAIEHYLSRSCLHLNSSCVHGSNCSFQLSPCEKSNDHFDVKEDGKVMHREAKQFLGVDEDGEHILTLVARKKMATKFRLVEHKRKKLTIRHRLVDEFVKVTVVKDRQLYEEFHAIVIPKEAVIQRAQMAKSGKDRYDIALVMIDSQSASNVKRRIKRVYDYLADDKDSFIFEGHSIVGDGTTAQLSALLTGAFEWDFPESRRGFQGGKPIDDWPFLFKDFANQGYATMFLEDDPVYGTFNYRLYGFQKQPTDHYLRPFWLASKRDYHADGICHGDTPIFTRSFNYLTDFYAHYNSTPKFTLTVLSAMFHDNLDKLTSIEDDLLKFIENSKTKKQFEDTILVLFGDHGARFDGFRESMTGKLEERLPFLSITLPKKFSNANPEVKEAMRQNQKVLTSFFDLHATLKHVLMYPAKPEVKIGQSIFNGIDPGTRTCEAAGIKEHWCPCLDFEEKNVTDEGIVTMAKAVVDFINVNITGENTLAKTICAELKLDRIQRAGEQKPNEKVRKFKQTSQNSKCIECDVIYAENERSKQQDLLHAYEIVFSVKPSSAVFEASVTIENNSTVIVNADISRLNSYGNQPKCLQDQYPLLRKYCYCL